MSPRALLAAAALLASAACGDGGSGSLEITDAWARPSPPTADTAAFYVEVDNGGSEPDRLTGASSDRCAMSELHSSETTDGIMTMGPAGADELLIPAGGRLTLEPGGLHAMCMGLTAPLIEGETIDVEFTFETAGTVEAAISVGDR